MHWGFCNQSESAARRDYCCDAWHWIANAGFSEEDYEPEDWQVIENARKEGFKILKGTQYIKVKGIWDGEWSVFRARKDLDAICRKYRLYCE